MEAVRGLCLLVSPNLVVRDLSLFMDWSRPAEHAAGAAVSDDVTQCDTRWQCAAICEDLATLNGGGKPAIHAHRFSDPVVLADYQSVLPPGAVIAGPLADTLHAGQLGQDALDWLKTNFYKTELELGHCLRLPQKDRANATSTSHAPSSSPLPSTRHGSANACAWSSS